jgi:hypothetical protein
MAFLLICLSIPLTGRADALRAELRGNDLCDGTWTVEPDLPLKDLELRLTGHLEIGPDEETRKQKVWTGKLITKPIVIIMGKTCAARLNKTGN